MRRPSAKGHDWMIPVGVAVLLVLLTAVLWEYRAFTGLFVDENAYRTEITAAARRHGLDPDLVRALVYQESRFDPSRRGSRGEIGLMQVLPGGAAAEWARVKKCPRPAESDLFRVDVNLDIGCWYLARALKRWSDYRCRLDLALADYNAGISRAREWAPPAKNGEVLPRVKIASTRKYISEITRRYRSYARKTAAEKRQTPVAGK